MPVLPLWGHGRIGKLLWLSRHSHYGGRYFNLEPGYDRSGPLSLTSPRFRNERELIAVETCRAALGRGSHGRHVHLVQMALIDLGFAMPISTVSNDYSPDGVYGAETEGVVKAFQRSVRGLQPDGVLGQLTLRELDRRHGRFTHRVNLHFRSLSLSDVPFDRIMSSSAQVYAQYGIELRFASGESLGLSTDDQNRFNVVTQNCDWQMDSGEFAELHRLGTPVPNNDVAVFIVNQFQENNSWLRRACLESASLRGEA